MNDTYLEHHGILGMRWGVRRYQNADGSYTKEGMRRYRQSEAAYDKVAADYKAGKANKYDVKIAKRKMSKNYDQLKNDYLADQGKKLYQSGKTITENNKVHTAVGTVANGSLLVGALMYKYGDKKIAYAAGATALGIHAVNGIIYGKNKSEAKRLRAYYTHSRPKD